MSDLETRNAMAMKSALEKQFQKLLEFNSKIESLQNLIGQQRLEIDELKRWRQQELIKNYGHGSTS